ncbi:MULTISPECIES: hypothetical protein [Mesonia]|uniref:Uncharacterized protein n=1 Tax=Mesonia oceanica TaxID=2687242 RepID=A0AC61Y5S5_9FLAO|nr:MULTISPECIES: hypothetical protein [Mesonia]MAN26630.1 hypothetical protein [Mesonia sp.]MAQ40898.1 hypothetical protein [Mesonia sp.]MBJ97819.1 hypothetical protein [Flavobacteriaceae bacterium]VVU99529.1 hypothetical protein FVB9532_00783 [Mesonia oceanica]|tara:strand:+ start:919 stop:1272 length:354 start_codon:yes stop_codon:yes gene_type:complete
MGFLKKILLGCVFIIIAYYISEKIIYKIRDSGSQSLVDYGNEVDYQGIIIDKFIDSTEHNIPTMILKGRKERIPITLYRNLNVGDSVVKKSGTLDLFVYKKDGETKTLKYPTLEYFQ